MTPAAAIPAENAAHIRRLLAMPGGAVHFVGVAGVGMAGVAYLLSDAASYITGITLDINGGMHM